MEQTIRDIQEKYVGLAVDLINEAKETQDKQLLSSFFRDIQKEYLAEVLQLEKKSLSADEMKKRNLISLKELEKKLIQEIALKLNIQQGNIKTAKQLLDTLFPEVEENDSKEGSVEGKETIIETIPDPDIWGNIENIGQIILPPDVREIILGIEEGLEKKERPAGFDKVGLIEEWLSKKLWKERTSFHRKVGILRDNQMRKVSYFQMYLPEYDTTLLLNNQYGEGIFVINGKFEDWNTTKSELKYGWAILLKFDYKDPQSIFPRLERCLWEEKVALWWAGQEKDKFSKEQINKEFIKSEFDKLWGFDVLQTYSQKEIYDIEFKGQKIKAISTLCGFDSKGNNLYLPEGFKKLLCFLYDKNYQELFWIDKKILLTYFDSLWGFDVLQHYSQKEIKDIEFKWQKIKTISTSCGFDTKDNFLQTPDGFKKFLCFIYDKNHQELFWIDQKILLEYFGTLWGLGVLQHYLQKDIKDIEFKGQKIHAMSVSCGFDTTNNNVLTSNGFRRFLCFLYNKDYLEVFWIDKKFLLEYFNSLWGFDVLQHYSQEEIKDIEVKWQKISSISTSCGFDTTSNNLHAPVGFKKFLCFLYNKDYQKLFWIDKKFLLEYFDTLWGFDVLQDYSQKEIRNFEFKGQKIKAISTLYGFDSKGNNLRTTEEFRKFLCFLYDKNYQKLFWIDKKILLKYFNSLGGFDVLEYYSQKEIFNIEFKGQKIMAIAASCGFDTKDNHVQGPKGFKKFLRFLYDRKLP